MHQDTYSYAPHCVPLRTPLRRSKVLKPSIHAGLRGFLRNKLFMFHLGRLRLPRYRALAPQRGVNWSPSFPRDFLIHKKDWSLKETWANLPTVGAMSI